MLINSSLEISWCRPKFYCPDTCVKGSESLPFAKTTLTLWPTGTVKFKGKVPDAAHKKHVEINVWVRMLLPSKRLVLPSMCKEDKSRQCLFETASSRRSRWLVSDLKQHLKVSSLSHYHIWLLRLPQSTATWKGWHAVRITRWHRSP